MARSLDMPITLSDVTTTIINQQSLSAEKRAFLMKRSKLTGNRSCFFEKAQESRTAVTQLRRLNTTIARLWNSDAANIVEEFKLQTMALNGLQVATELIEFIDLIRKVNGDITKKDALKIGLNVAGMVALGFITLGMDIFPLVGIGSALRSVTGSGRILMRAYENKQKLQALTEKMDKIRTQLASHSSIELCQQYVSLELKYTALKAHVDSQVVRASEAFLHAGNVLLLIGATMSFIPGMEALGILLSTIGVAVKLVAGLVSLAGSAYAKKVISIPVQPEIADADKAESLSTRGCPI